MNVLYLVHRIPFPPDKGDKIRSHRWLCHLAENHRIHLITLYDDPADAVHLEHLRGICASVHAFPINKSGAQFKALKGLLGRRPLSLPYFDSADARAAVRKVLAEESIDVALCYSSPMAQYLEGLEVPTRLMDMVDVDSEKFRSYAALGHGPKSWIYGIEARRLSRFEEKLVEEFDSVILCTDQEAALLSDRVDHPEKVAAIGNGVELPPLSAIPEKRQEPNLLFIGAMDYQANIDAVIFAAEEIMPLILDERSDAVFQVVGRDPSREVLALNGLPGVEVMGAVADISQYLRHAALALVPLRVAQGIQNKVLEAMAWGLPVITAPRIVSSLGLDDLGPMLMAERPADYARAVLHLLSEPDECRRRGIDGRAFVTEAFSWEPRLAALDNLILQCQGLKEQPV